MAVDSVDRRPGRNKQDGRRRPVEKGSGWRRPGRKEQDGQRRPVEKGRMVDVNQEKGQNFEKQKTFYYFQMFLAKFLTIQLVMKSAVDQ